MLRAQGVSLNEIARRLGRNKSTVSRELSRNGGAIYQSYGGGSADRRARARRQNASQRERLRVPGVRAFVRRKLRCGWSPEQIAGRLPREVPGCHISHEAIYQYVYDRSVRCRDNLVPCLARAHWKRQNKGHRHTHRDPHIPARISILDRPSSITARRQVGHWENDLIISRQSSAALNILVERKTRYSKLTKVAHHTPHATRCAITRTLSRLPRAARRSITYDNGHENLHHRQINEVLGTSSYFCEPYHSWEKGTVENTVSLVRRYFPKRTDFTTIDIRRIKQVERQLNDRPRKILNFRTPREAFTRAVALQR